MRDVDSQVRALQSLHDYAGWFGEATAHGVRVTRTCMLEMILELGIDEGEVQALLVRLRRLGLAIPADSGAVILTDVPRLLDFARFVATQRGEPPRNSVVSPAGSTTALPELNEAG